MAIPYDLTAARNVLDQNSPYSKSIPDDVILNMISAGAQPVIDQLTEGFLDGATHLCRKCHFAYTPKPGVSEDCPLCGYDGK
jgi:rubrerythrin